MVDETSLSLKYVAIKPMSGFVLDQESLNQISRLVESRKRLDTYRTRKAELLAKLEILDAHIRNESLEEQTIYRTLQTRGMQDPQPQHQPYRNISSDLQAQLSNMQQQINNVTHPPSPMPQRRGTNIMDTPVSYSNTPSISPMASVPTSYNNDSARWGMAPPMPQRTISPTSIPNPY